MERLHRRRQLRRAVAGAREQWRCRGEERTSHPFWTMRPLTSGSYIYN
jgi:hypothetical protein